MKVWEEAWFAVGGGGDVRKVQHGQGCLSCWCTDATCVRYECMTHVAAADLLLSLLLFPGTGPCTLPPAAAVLRPGRSHL